jgi:hypothetical protein
MRLRRSVLAFLAAALVGACVERPVATSLSSAIAPPPTPAITCLGETGSVPAMLAADPCPAAEVAVQLVVASVRLPIDRIVIEPGPFYCDDVWPGTGTPRACYGGAVQPGQFMHAWVSFRQSNMVAAVMLGLNLPDDLNEPRATRPPWRATLVKIEVPPAGWVMP